MSLVVLLCPLSRVPPVPALDWRPFTIFRRGVVAQDRYVVYNVVRDS
jgi:hypothetical protein